MVDIIAPWDHSLSSLYSSTFSTWVTLPGVQEYKTPADIALGVMETRKLPHHDKVMIPSRQEVVLFFYLGPRPGVGNYFFHGGT